MSKGFKTKYFPDSARDVLCIGRALCDIIRYSKSNFPARIQILFDDKEMQFAFEETVIAYFLSTLSCEELNELLEDAHSLNQDDQ